MMPVCEKRNRIYGVLVFVLLLFSMQHVQAAALNVADDAALVALYNATAGTGWTNKTGWSGTVGVMDTVTNPPYGVTFDGSARVTQVSLGNNNLVGDITALDLSGLSFTTTLSFSNNSMSGSLPAAAQLPSGLQTLNLGSNQMSGAFPDYSGLTLLTTLQLYSNLFNGSLPDAALFPDTIETINLGTNQYSGSFPDYSSLPQLKWLFLGNNQLSGSPPVAALLPTTIQGLTLSSNQLTGTIPDYSSLTTLGTLYLYFNQLTGSLPTAAELPPLISSLALYGNQFSGTFPDYSTLSNLQILYLYDNQLSGTLPTLAQLPSGLTDLNLSVNQFSGIIPDYSSLPLFYFNLSKLNIQGPTPSGLLALSGTGVMTTTPAIDPALDGSYVSSSVIPVTGTGGELSGTVDLFLDGAAEASGIAVGGAGEWSSSVDLTGKGDGIYLVTAKSTFNGWPGHTPATVSSDVSSTAVTLYIDTTSPVISLIGPATQTVAQGSVYSDLGATVSDNIDTSLTAIVSGSVDTSTVGSYTLTFNATDNGGNVATPVERTVTVTDQTAPVITLLGSNPMTVNQGSSFTDPGTTVSDNVDTGLTATVSGSVDTATVGSYILTYNAVDTAGNAATAVTRTVNVVAAPSSGGGGGSFGWMLLLTLMLHFTMTRRRAAE